MSVSSVRRSATIRWERIKNDSCDEWGCFNDFFKWWKSKGLDVGKTVVKIDRRFPYSPENIKIIDVEKIVDYKGKEFDYEGERHTLREWCKIKGLNCETIRRRITDNKWDIKRALETPIKIKN